MIAAMIDTNHISERLASLKLEMSDLRVANARYWSRKEHTALDKSASALRQQRLIQIKLELADMRTRCAYIPHPDSTESRCSQAPLSIAILKRYLLPTSPPSFIPPPRLRQTSSASAYLKGNSSVAE